MVTHVERYLEIEKVPNFCVAHFLHQDTSVVSFLTVSEREESKVTVVHGLYEFHLRAKVLKLL